MLRSSGHLDSGHLDVGLNYPSDNWEDKERRRGDHYSVPSELSQVQSQPNKPSKRQLPFQPPPSPSSSKGNNKGHNSHRPALQRGSSVGAEFSSTPSRNAINQVPNSNGYSSEQESKFYEYEPIYNDSKGSVLDSTTQNSALNIENGEEYHNTYPGEGEDWENYGYYDEYGNFMDEQIYSDETEITPQTAIPVPPSTALETVIPNHRDLGKGKKQGTQAGNQNHVSDTVAQPEPLPVNHGRLPLDYSLEEDPEYPLDPDYPSPWNGSNQLWNGYDQEGELQLPGKPVKNGTTESEYYGDSPEVGYGYHSNNHFPPPPPIIETEEIVGRGGRGGEGGRRSTENRNSLLEFIPGKEKAATNISSFTPQRQTEGMSPAEKWLWVYHRIATNLMVKLPS